MGIGFIGLLVLLVYSNYMDENPTTELLNILSKAMNNKVYGSIEIYIEDGQITQISQRVIKKIKRPRSDVFSNTKSSVSVKKSSREISLS